MSPRLKVVIACFAAATVILPAYFNIRLNIMEETHVKRIVRETIAVTDLFRASGLAGGAAVPRPEEKLEAFVKAATGAYPRLALCAVSDRGMATRMAAKNDRYIPTTIVYDAILQDFTRDRITVSRERPFMVRYYGNTANRGDEKFYLFVTRVDDWRILAVWPSFLDRQAITRIALESGLIVFTLSLGGLVVGLMAIRRRAAPGSPGGAAQPVTVTAPGEQISAIPVNLDLAVQSLEREDAVSSRPTRTAAGNTLRDYVIDIFKKIDGAYAPETVSLYLRHYPDRLSRTYELKGHSFLTYDAGSFDHIELASDVGRELTGASVMVLEGGRSIVIPLIYREQIIAAVTLARAGGFSGAEIGAIGGLFTVILKELNDFLLVSEVMTDPATGLHSKAYFAVKYRELLASGGGGFALVMIALFDGLPAPDAALSARIMKILAPALREGFPPGASLFRHDALVAVLVPAMTPDEASACVLSLKESLARYQIKVSDTEIIKLTPRVLAAAAMAGGPDPLTALLSQFPDAAA